MAGKSKPSARDAFDDNLSDAEALVAFARALRNRRVRRMRRELREKLGSALGLAMKTWDDLDCIESDDLFAVFKPNGTLNRDNVTDKNLRPLLRQALVAACAAVETFVADRVMERLRAALDCDPRPEPLRRLPMTVGDWLRIDATYERPVWGLRQHIEAQVRGLASAAPSQIGKTFGVVGQKNLWKRVDKRRKKPKRTSERELETIYGRRNRIAHQGDRDGRGRSAITVDEVECDLAAIREIVGALDEETAT